MRRFWLNPADNEPEISGKYLSARLSARSHAAHLASCRLKVGCRLKSSAQSQPRNLVSV